MKTPTHPILFMAISLFCTPALAQTMSEAELLDRCIAEKPSNTHRTCKPTASLLFECLKEMPSKSHSDCMTQIQQPGEAERLGSIKTDRETKETLAAIAAREAESARKAKLPGVRLGMSKKTVMTKTNWGEPERINRTITSAGVREQWVYGGAYLYFENGKLVAIQD